MRLATLLLVAATTACTSQTTEGTWTVNMTVDHLGCLDLEPANVTFLMDVHTPQIATAGLVQDNLQGATTLCGGPGQPEGPTVDLSSAPFVPASAILTATITDLGFNVDTGTPDDPMPTTYTMTLSGDQLTGDAVYHARPDCTDRWTLTASAGE